MNLGQAQVFLGGSISTVNLIPAERAIEHKDQDTLGRDQFVRRLTRVLISPKTKKATGTVVGLTGTWGSGKSSILNLVQEHMAAEWPDAILVQFNPWLISGRNDLIKEFFGELRSAIAKSQALEARKLLKNLVDYGERMSPALNYVPYGALGRVLLRVGKSALDKNESLTELRKRLLTDLSTFPSPIVVMIDEVDRVDNSDILAIAQLVRSIADFPNISYLLAYDAIRVADALGSGNQERGRDYLEKIVQLQIPIPVITADELANVLRAELARISEFTLPDEFWNIPRYLEIEGIIAVRIFYTLRDVKRLIGNFRAVFAMIQGEADWIDTLGYCVLLTKVPDVVHHLRENMERVIDDPISEAELMHRAMSREKNTDDLLDEFLQKEGNRAGIGSLLKALFPRFGGTRSKNAHVDPISKRRTLLVILRLGILPGTWSRKDLLSFSQRSVDTIAADLKSLKERDQLTNFVDRLGEIYGDLQTFDHSAFWLGVATFSTRKPPSWTTHYTGLVYDIRELSEVILRWCRNSSDLTKVARSVFQTLKADRNISLTSRWLHHHAFAYGLFGRDLRSGYGTFLSVEETIQETHEHCKLWTQLHNRGELLPSGSDLMPVYVMNAAGYWNNEMRGLLAKEIERHEAAVDGLGLMLFGPGYSTETQLLEAIVGTNAFLSCARRRLSSSGSPLHETAANSLRRAIEELSSEDA